MNSELACSLFEYEETHGSVALSDDRIVYSIHTDRSLYLSPYIALELVSSIVGQMIRINDGRYCRGWRGNETAAAAATDGFARIVKSVILLI